MDERRDYQRGRNASLAGKPRDSRQNIDWLLGWDEVHADRMLDETDNSECQNDV